MNQNQGRICPECASDMDRRDFLKASAALAACAMPAVSGVLAAPTRKSAAESAVQRLYETLTDEQKKIMVLDYNDPRRTRISANWSVTKASVGSFSKEQQSIIRDIVKGVTSEDGFDLLMKQMQADWGGFERYAVAIFGNPKKGPFQFELTGRHLTLRADGDTLPGAAFGGSDRLRSRTEQSGQKLLLLSNPGCQQGLWRLGRQTA
ncbi:MAG: hypothetical protein KatS3mg105_1661 [Gemmatales bacterium]|nr:MAG: hypothetical protein KatS3mg105_1661 [Gemmatales bacterium]